MARVISHVDCSADLNINFSQLTSEKNEDLSYSKLFGTSWLWNRGASIASLIFWLNHKTLAITSTMADIIFEPPAALIAMRTLYFWSAKIIGDIEDMGRFCGDTKFVGDGGNLKIFVWPGDEKSFMALLKTMPVRLPTWPEPKLQRGVKNKMKMKSIFEQESARKVLTNHLR